MQVNLVEINKRFDLVAKYTQTVPPIPRVTVPHSPEFTLQMLLLCVRVGLTRLVMLITWVKVVKKIL